MAYTDSQGTPILREEICKLYKTVSADNIMVAAPQELIAMALRAMLKPGDHVVAVCPGYQSLYEVAQSIGCEVSFWEPDVQHNGSFAFDVSILTQPGRNLQHAMPVISTIQQSGMQGWTLLHECPPLTST